MFISPLPATLEQTHLIPSRLLSPHARFYTREMRILAYTQLLESYRSLTLDSLCSAFGVERGWADVTFASILLYLTRRAFHWNLILMCTLAQR